MGGPHHAFVDAAERPKLPKLALAVHVNSETALLAELATIIA